MESNKLSAVEDQTLVQPELMVDGATALSPDEEITREQRRSRRKRDVRARTISVKRMTKRELEIGSSCIPRPTTTSPRRAPSVPRARALVPTSPASITCSSTCRRELVRSS